MENEIKRQLAKEFAFDLYDTQFDYDSETVLKQEQSIASILEVEVNPEVIRRGFIRFMNDEITADGLVDYILSGGIRR